jgi:hypothetical protein
MTEEIRIGSWRIYYDPPPIPVRYCDWHYIHDDYDASWEGEEDGWVSNGLGGSAESPEACLEEIRDYEDEHFDCQCSAAHPAECMALACARRDVFTQSLGDRR